MLLSIDPSRLHALYGKEARQEVSILQSKAECDEIFGVQWGLLHVDRFVQGMAAVLGCMRRYNEGRGMQCVDVCAPGFTVTITSDITLGNDSLVTLEKWPSLLPSLMHWTHVQLEK